MWWAAVSQEKACKQLAARCAPSCLPSAHTALTHWNTSEAADSRPLPALLPPSITRTSATPQLRDSAMDACSDARHAVAQSSGTTSHVELMPCAGDERDSSEI